jgi:hypothetical protein
MQALNQARPRKHNQAKPRRHIQAKHWKHQSKDKGNGEHSGMPGVLGQSPCAPWTHGASHFPSGLQHSSPTAVRSISHPTLGLGHSVCFPRIRLWFAGVAQPAATGPIPASGNEQQQPRSRTTPQVHVLMVLYSA